MSVSLIITTYNWPEALVATLYSALRQNETDFELVIADDGSAEETARAARNMLSGSGIAWRHVRHEDKGIRQARIKNLAVRYARGDYLIFIDHDCPLHPDFIADHSRSRQMGCFLQGKRCFLPAGLSGTHLHNGSFSPPSLFIYGLGNRKNAFRSILLGRLITRRKKFQTSLRGCNLSMDRRAFMAVDGYDEIFDGLWGREDSDICYRLFHGGYRVKNLWFSALQYHLHHPLIKRVGRDRLDDELDRCRSSRRVSALQGYSRMSSEGACIDGEG